MQVFTDKKNILWDFDGVLIDSSEIRDKGFRDVLAGFPEDQVEELMAYHQANGGLSRYVKFNYFFEIIRKEVITEEQLLDYARSFSRIMRRELKNKKYLIADSLRFLQREYHNFEMHLISGSDGDELRFLAGELGIEKYFRSIAGSPTPKVQLLEQLMKEYKYSPVETVYVGDSLNDFEAAEANGIPFFGYNNEKLRTVGMAYLNFFPK